MCSLQRMWHTLELPTHRKTRSMKRSLRELYNLDGYRTPTHVNTSCDYNHSASLNRPKENVFTTENVAYIGVANTQVNEAIPP